MTTKIKFVICNVDTKLANDTFRIKTILCKKFNRHDKRRKNLSFVVKCDYGTFSIDLYNGHNGHDKNKKHEKRSENFNKLIFNSINVKPSVFIIVIFVYNVHFYFL